MIYTSVGIIYFFSFVIKRDPLYRHERRWYWCLYFLNAYIYILVYLSENVLGIKTGSLLLTVFRRRGADFSALRPVLFWNNRPSSDRTSTATGTGRCYPSDRLCRRAGTRGRRQRSATSTERWRTSSWSRGREGEKLPTLRVYKRERERKKLQYENTAIITLASKVLVARRPIA